MNDVETPNNQYQSNDPFKRLKYYLKYQTGDGEWKEVGTQKGNRFEPTSFFRSDLWVVPENYIRPTVKTKKMADIINFLKPYPSIHQEILDEEERQRQAEERQRQEQLRLEREERQRQRQQEEEEKRQRVLERRRIRILKEQEEEEKRKQNEEERQQRLEQERERRLRQLEEEKRKNQQYEKTTRSGRTTKVNSKYNE